MGIKSHFHTDIKWLLQFKIFNGRKHCGWHKYITLPNSLPFQHGDGYLSCTTLITQSMPMLHLHKRMWDIVRKAGACTDIKALQAVILEGQSVDKSSGSYMNSTNATLFRWVHIFLLLLICN
jgi:hypothetical protein